MRLHLLVLCAGKIVPPGRTGMQTSTIKSEPAALSTLSTNLHHVPLPPFSFAAFLLYREVCVVGVFSFSPPQFCAPQTPSGPPFKKPRFPTALPKSRSRFPTFFRLDHCPFLAPPKTPANRSCSRHGDLRVLYVNHESSGGKIFEKSSLNGL